MTRIGMGMGMGKGMGMGMGKGKGKGMTVVLVVGVASLCLLLARTVQRKSSDFRRNFKNTDYCFSIYLITFFVVTVPP